MSTTTSYLTPGARAPRRLTTVPDRAERPAAALATAAARVELSRAFAATVARYLLLVAPVATVEIARWEAAAAAIPDRSLRSSARVALRKRGNIEGATLFAVLAPAGHRRAAIRALVALQSAYNYLDTLSEQPSENPLANARQLHLGLVSALQDPGAPHPDYYAHSPRREDSGYLLAMLDACREAVAELPAYPAIASTLGQAAGRIVDFQTFNLSDSQGGHGALQRWGTELTPARSGLAWWEAAAGGGSSLAVHALIASAADPTLDPCEASRIERVYFPWAGALHSLLDSLVDRREDRAGGRRCLLDYYASDDAAADRLAALAACALDTTRELASASTHAVILTAMCSYYLSAPECDTAEARAVARALTGALGTPLHVAIAMSRARRLLHAIARR
jgi:tetraprenyl-beta-curcumene synthase